MKTLSNLRSNFVYAVVGTGAILAFVPFVLSSSYLLQVLIIVLLFVTLGVSWNLLGGYSGQLSLGHAVFFGIGAYGVALLSKPLGQSPWLGLLAGAVLSLPLAAFVGYVCFRLRGPYFTLATIALAEVIRLVVLNSVDLTGGAKGVTVRPLFKGVDKAPWYLLALGLAVFVVLVTYLITRSKLGYYLVAIREDEDAAEAVGVDATGYKMVALAISAFFTSVAGGFFASYLSFIEPDMVLSVERSVEICLLAIIGGLGTILGPVVGALILGLAGEWFRTNLGQAHLLTYGVLLVAVIMFMPEGIVGTMKKAGQVIGKRLSEERRRVTA